MTKKYVPKRGDYIFVNLNPTKGHEQRGYRPALVISNNDFNKSGSCFICPITSKAKLNRPFTVPSYVEEIEGTILVEQHVLLIGKLEALLLVILRMGIR